MPLEATYIYEFGSFSLDVEEQRLFRENEPLPLTPKAFETLLLLVKRSGHVVQKDELLREVWKDAFVEEGVVAQNVFALRRVLEHDQDGRRYIETVPKRGYRFIADVREVAKNSSERVLQQQTRARILIEEEIEDERIGENPIEQKQASPGVYEYLKSTRNVFVVLIASCLAVAGFFYVRSVMRDRGFVAKRIAVLPFKPLGADSGDEFLGLGMADALIIKTSHFQELSVLPTSAVFRFSGREQNPLDAGRQLGVDAVVDGTVQHVGDRVRVTAQLIRVSNGHILWSGTYDERFTNIFALQDTMSEQMSGALALQVSGEERKLLTRPNTTDPEAYQAYLMGLYFWNKRTKDGLSKAVAYFQQAISMDPGYARAYAGLADSFYLIAFYRYDAVLNHKEAFEKGKTAASKALELDDRLARAHLAMAMIQWDYDRDVSAAERSFERAIGIDSNDATTHQRYGLFLRFKGQLEASIEHISQAQELDPLSSIINGALASVLVDAHRYDEAIKFSEKAIELNPEFDGSHLIKGEAYELQEKYPEALAEFEKARRLASSPGYALGALGHTYAMMGQKSEALRIIKELSNLVKNKDQNSLYGTALVYAALNEKDLAFDWLDKAIEADYTTPDWLGYDPQLDSLRSDARFKDLLRRHNLTQAADQPSS